MISVSSNQVSIAGNTRGDARGAIVSLFQIVQQGYQDIDLDFSGATFADADVMLPIVSYASYYRLNRIDFSLTLPADPKLGRLFVNTNWAHLIEPTKYPHNERRVGNNLPALQFKDSDAQFNVVDKAMDTLMGSIVVSNRKQLKALEWAINEVTDNVLNHAESAIGGILQIQTFPTQECVKFYVVDAGLGIPATLRKAMPTLNSDSIALDKAIREGVTRNKQTNQGNGLFGTFKCCEESGGAMYIRSNHATLDFKQSTLHVRNDAVPFRGALIAATIKYTSEGLLDRALVFGGKKHEPGNDYIDMHYSQINDKVIFQLAEEAEGFGSREFGKRVKTKIDNILLDNKSGILFDFGGVELISSSFADEVFGKLFVQIGALEFMRRFEFRSIEATVKRLVDRAIMQRAKEA